MSHRHLARSIVMQTLFEWDFNGCKDDGLREMLHRNITEFAAGIDNVDFLEELTLGVAKNRTVIDEVIEKAAPEWPLEKINVIDRNILRLGLQELLFGNREQVPPKVAINEAIELAKSFGGENSGRFINGVLGAVYKEIGEPGKDQTGKKKQVEVDLSSAPVEKKGAAVVYSIDDAGTIRFAMVHDVFGYWTLSKGSIEEGETVEAGTVREIKEEIGIASVIEQKLGENEYVAFPPPDNKPVRKQVTYFLARSNFEKLTLDTGTGGLDQAQWFTLDEIADLVMYDDVTQMIAQSIEIITTT